MDVKTILDVLQVLLYVALGGLTIYFKTKSVLRDKAGEFITTAENEAKDVVDEKGGKHNYIVDLLFGFIPKPLQVIFSRALIDGIVDKAFKAAESYAVTQLDKAVDKIVRTDTATIDTAVTSINTETETK